MDSDVEGLESGLAAYELKEYAKAFELLMPLAEQGVPEAQAIIGDFYFLGLGGVVPVSGPETVRWWTKAGEGGYSLSYWNLGTIYTAGMPGVACDPEQALRCKEKAVELGFDMIPMGWRDG
jgi:TPR repeat protein